jgi:hypothetical protein
LIAEFSIAGSLLAVAVRVVRKRGQPLFGVEKGQPVPSRTALSKLIHSSIGATTASSEGARAVDRSNDEVQI